jgi:hypothetical protein
MTEPSTLFYEGDEPVFWLERRSSTGPPTLLPLSALVEEQHRSNTFITSLPRFWRLVNSLDLEVLRDRNDLTVHFFAPGCRPSWEAFPNGAVAKLYRSDLSRRVGLPGAGDMDEYWHRCCSAMLFAMLAANEHKHSATSPTETELPWCNFAGVSSANDVVKFWFRDTTGADAGGCSTCRWKPTPEYRQNIEAALIRLLAPNGPDRQTAVGSLSPIAVPGSDLCVSISSTAQLMKRAHRATSSYSGGGHSRNSSGGGHSRNSSSTTPASASVSFHRRGSASSFDFTSRAAEIPELDTPTQPLRASGLHRRTRSETHAWLSASPVGSPRRVAHSGTSSMGSSSSYAARGHGRTESTLLVPGLPVHGQRLEDARFGAVGAGNLYGTSPVTSAFDSGIHVGLSPSLAGLPDPVGSRSPHQGFGPPALATRSPQPAWQQDALLSFLQTQTDSSPSLADSTESRPEVIADGQISSRDAKAVMNMAMAMKQRAAEDPAFHEAMMAAAASMRPATASERQRLAQLTALQHAHVQRPPPPVNDRFPAPAAVGTAKPVRIDVASAPMTLTIGGPPGQPIALPTIDVGGIRISLPVMPPPTPIRKAVDPNEPPTPPPSKPPQDKTKTVSQALRKQPPQQAGGSSQEKSASTKTANGSSAPQNAWAKSLLDPAGSTANTDPSQPGAAAQADADQKKKKTRRGKRAGQKVRERETLLAAAALVKDLREQEEREGRAHPGDLSNDDESGGSVVDAGEDDDAKADAEVDSNRFHTPVSNPHESVAEPTFSDDHTFEFSREKPTEGGLSRLASAASDISAITQDLFLAMRAQASLAALAQQHQTEDDGTVVVDSSDDDTVNFGQSLQDVAPLLPGSAAPVTPHTKSMPSALSTNAAARRSHGRSVSFGDPSVSPILTVTVGLPANKPASALLVPLPAAADRWLGLQPAVGREAPKPQSAALAALNDNRRPLPAEVQPTAPRRTHTRQPSERSLGEIMEAKPYLVNNWKAAAYDETDEFFQEHSTAQLAEGHPAQETY